MTTITGTPDQKTEAFLNKLQARGWYYTESVDLSKIDWEASRNNQTRIQEPINKEVVERYVENMRNDDVFPPLILWERSDGSFFILDGLHRATAYAQLDESPDAYVVPPETPLNIRTLISITYNARHGLALSKADRVRHAMFLKESAQLSSAEAARQMGLKLSELQGAIDIENANQRMAECLLDGVEFHPGTWDNLKATTRVALSRIKTDEGFLAAVQLAHDAALGKSAVDDLVKELRPIRSAKGQVQVVNRWRSNLGEAIQAAATTGVGRARNAAMPQHVRAALVLSGVEGLDPARLVAMQQREREMVAERAAKAIERLQEVLDALKTAEASA